MSQSTISCMNAWNQNSCTFVLNANEMQFTTSHHCQGVCISQSWEMWWPCLWKPHWIGFRKLITSSPKTLPWPMCKLLNCISFAFKTKVHEFWFQAFMQDIVLWKIYFSSSLSRSKAKIISVVLWNSEFIVSKIKTAACIEFCVRIGA